MYSFSSFDILRAINVTSFMTLHPLSVDTWNHKFEPARSVRGSAIICRPWMSVENCVPFSYINYKARYFSALMKLGPRSTGRKPGEQLLFVYLWSFLFSACLSRLSCLWRHHRPSVYLSGWAAFRKILIKSPPSLLAFALIDWCTSAGMEPERWLKWQSKTETKNRTEPAHQAHKRQGLTPSPFLYKS